MTINFKPHGRGKLSALQAQKTRRHAFRRGPASRHGGQRRYVDPEVVFNDLLLELRETNNGFAWACCPFHDDNNPSFSVNLRTGWYRCFSSSCGQAGSSIGGFVGALLALEPAEARRYLEDRYG